MISDLQRLALVPLAAILFLFAAQASAGLTLRANPTTPIVVAAR